MRVQRWLRRLLRRTIQPVDGELIASLAFNGVPIHEKWNFAKRVPCTIEPWGRTGQRAIAKGPVTWVDVPEGHTINGIALSLYAFGNSPVAVSNILPIVTVGGDFEVRDIELRIT